jgi:hypothetical protein
MTLTAPEQAELGSDLLADQEYRVVPIDSIRPHPLNPNEGDEVGIAESIRTNQFYGAPTVREHPDGDGYEMLAGEHRWRQLREQGSAVIPVIVQLECDDRRALRILLADNELAKRSRYKPDVLETVLQTLGDLDGTGFHLDQLASLEARDRAEHTPEPDLDGGDPGPGPVKEFHSEYGLVVVFDNEAAQRELYDRLRSEGFSVRVVAI